MKISGIQLLENIKPAKHPKCKGYWSHTPNGSEFDCEYGPVIICEDCKYGAGRKDPEAKCNQIKERE